MNYNHLMPTRYTLDVDLKTTVTPDVLENATKKVAARKAGSAAQRVLLPVTRINVIVRSQPLYYVLAGSNPAGFNTLKEERKM